MKIFSWNINGIRAVEKKGNLAEFLSVKNPDIACFQEIKIDETQISTREQQFGQSKSRRRFCEIFHNKF